MKPVKLFSKDKDNQNYITRKNTYIYLIIIIIIVIFYFIIYKILSHKNKHKSSKFEFNNSLKSINQNCYSSPENSVKSILHLIITRFLFQFYSINDFPFLYKEEYILNGIKVMKKYLFPSLENQSCKNFTWILMLGDKANITLIDSLLKFNNTFDMKIIYKKDFKNYVRNITKDIDVLITTRIDYDDRIYYDAVNDVRKAININKPMILYGYNRGFFYFEVDDKYYDYYNTFNNQGVMSIFISLITVLNKVNDIYTIYDIGTHMNIRKNLLKKYKSFGIKKLNYEPAIFDSGGPKFVWVRQNYSGCYNMTRQIQKSLKSNNINLIKFYGK